MHGNHTLKRGNPFSVRKLVGQRLHPDRQDEANHDTLSVRHDQTKHPKAAENTGLYAIPTAYCVCKHTLLKVIHFLQALFLMTE